jgi:hypothetical protein
MVRYLFVLLRELAIIDVGVLVNDLRHSDDLVIGVFYGHAQQGVRVVPCYAINFVIEPRILK